MIWVAIVFLTAFAILGYKAKSLDEEKETNLPTEHASQQIDVLTNNAMSKMLSCAYTKPYVIVDVETTGLNPSSDRIIQISAIKFDASGNMTDTFDTYINPDIHIPARASSINHITDRMVASAPRAADIRDGFLDFLGNSLIVGYNTIFDLKFLNAEFPDAFVGREYVDVLKIARESLSLDNYRLETVARAVGHMSSSYHNSLYDCAATAEVLRYIRVDLSEWTEIFSVRKPRERIEPYYDASFYKGLNLYNEGEQARLEGDFEKALQMFRNALDSGYNIPAVYYSYAMVYRKQKDYQKEIDILDEGIRSLGDSAAQDLKYRKTRAAQLLQSQEVRQVEECLRAQRKAEREMKKKLEAEAKAMRQTTNGARPVLQLTDSGILLNRFESVALAARNTGVSTKSIRCAANGTQKHAGGYCWRYEDAPVQE